MVATTNSRAVTGGAFQMTKEAVADNRYAPAGCSRRGFAPPIVIGHSNGGMLAVQHVADHPETPALVLLSAHLGGRDIVPLASKVGLLGGDRIDEVDGDGARDGGAGPRAELMLLPGWWHVITAQSYLDYCAELPDVLALAPGSHARCCTSAATRSRRTSIRPRNSPRARVGGATCASCPTAIISMVGGRMQWQASSPNGSTRCWRKLELAHRRATRHNADNEKTYWEETMALRRRTVLKGLGASALAVTHAWVHARRPARCASDF
jgi:hypothetical protein